MLRIIITGYNCENFVAKCYNSLMAQTDKDFEYIFINDGSTDGTLNEIKKVTYDLISYDENRGAARNRHEYIKAKAEDDDIILFLGMDDELLPHAIETVKAQYNNGKWMTYGNWVNQFGDGLPQSFDLDFDEQTHKNRDYRRVKYRSTAPNTFKAFLYKCIKDEDLKYEGNWFTCCTEGEVMFSCLEQCGKDRIGIIRDHIYMYNESNSIKNSANTHNGTLKRFGVQYKYSIYNVIINRPKRNLL